MKKVLVYGNDVKEVKIYRGIKVFCGELGFNENTVRNALSKHKVWEDRRSGKVLFWVDVVGNEGRGGGRDNRGMLPKRVKK